MSQEGGHSLRKKIKEREYNVTERERLNWRRSCSLVLLVCGIRACQYTPKSKEDREGGWGCGVGVGGGGGGSGRACHCVVDEKKTVKFLAHKSHYYSLITFLFPPIISALCIVSMPASEDAFYM